MSSKQLHVIKPKDNRQAQIEALEVGSSVAIAQRVLINFGVADGVFKFHKDRLRAILEQQAIRARSRIAEARYTIEVGNYLSHVEAVLIVAVITRIN